MRTRTAALSLAAALALSPVLAACSDDTPDTTVTDDGVVETPTDQPNGGNGLDARSGDPLAPADPSTVPSPQDQPSVSAS